MTMNFLIDFSDQHNFDMNKFVKYDWSELGCLDLRGCYLDDQVWQVFVENQEKFKNLKIIYLSNIIFFYYLCRSK